MRTLRSFSPVGNWCQTLQGLIVVGASLLAGGAWAQAPENDNFATAQVISGLWGSVTNDNTMATAEPGEPSHAGIVPMASLWYKWTAPDDGEVTMDTFGSLGPITFLPLDTVHAVYVGTSLTTLRQVAAADNLMPVPQYNSTTPMVGGYQQGGYQQFLNYGPGVIRFNAVKGTTYYIAVDGNINSFGFPLGTTVLNWAYHPGGVFRFATEDIDFFSFKPLYECADWEATRWDDAEFKTYYRYDVPGLLVTVTRLAGSSGRMLVDFSTGDLAEDSYDTNEQTLAVADMDYTPVSGTLIFDDFEMSKDILIPIIYDNFLAQPNRVFGVFLSNARRDPTESTEVSDPITDPIGGTAVVRILDTDIDPVF